MSYDTSSQASAIFWGAALTGPGRHNTVIPYGATIERGEVKRHPLVAGYHGKEVPWTDRHYKEPQNERLWKAWLREGAGPSRTRPDAWAIAPGRLGLVVVDIDDPAMVDELLDLYGETEVFVITPSGGMHLYYSAPSGVDVSSKTGVRGAGSYDIKAIGSTVHAPGSRHHRCDGLYTAHAPGIVDGALFSVAGGRAVPVLKHGSLWSLLPVFPAAVADAEWLEHHPPTETPDDLTARELTGTPEELSFARRYMRAVGPAVSGYGGHDVTRKLIWKLGDFGFPEEIGRELMHEWNADNEPPWTDDELESKIRHYYSHRDFPIGWRAAEVFGAADDATGDEDEDDVIDIDDETYAKAIAAAKRASVEPAPQDIDTRIRALKYA